MVRFTLKWSTFDQQPAAVHLNVLVFIQMTKKTLLTWALALCCTITLAADPEIVPLFDESTKREPATTEETADALVTRISDRVRDRHAREDGAYDHYLSFYWEERTVTIELIDRVAKGGKEITVNITSLSPLNNPLVNPQQLVGTLQVGAGHYNTNRSSVCGTVSEYTGCLTGDPIPP